MATHIIVGQFRDYGAAHRAFYELLQAGIVPNDISIIAGDRSNHHATNRDFGILEEGAERYLAAVRGGRTLLAVDADEADHTRIAAIIEHHAPIEIDEGEIEESRHSAAIFPPTRA
jgi:hypothetical protein